MSTEQYFLFPLKNTWQTNDEIPFSQIFDLKVETQTWSSAQKYFQLEPKMNV